MDVVIPLRKSINDDIELRYALRSIEKYAPDPGNVFIIGDCPSWIASVIHIPANDSPGNSSKERNIFKKVMIACQDQRVSDDFLYTNDDIFLLSEFPMAYHHKGMLSETYSKLSLHQSYRFTVSNTINLLQGGKDFDTHAPMVYNKEMFLRSVGRPFKWPAWGYCIKSLYCNLNGIEGEYYPDLKIKKQLKKDEIARLISGRQYFSLGDHALNQNMKEVLQELYPNKSIYEN